MHQASGVKFVAVYDVDGLLLANQDDADGTKNFLMPLQRLSNGLSISSHHWRSLWGRKWS